MHRYALIGPTYPFRGGIAHYTTLLALYLRESHETLFISFTRQYPRWIFPGRSDRDPSQEPLRTPAEYLLDPVNPLSWRRTLRRLEYWKPEVVVIPWWVPFWAPAWAVLGRGIKRLESSPKLLFICHNVLPHERGPLDRLALRLALGPGDGYITHSMKDKERLLREFPYARVQVSPHPTYSALSEHIVGELPVTLPSDRPLLLFCGFVRPYKGLDVLLEALPLVLVNRPVHLLVAGEFWNGMKLYEEQIGRLGIAEAVTLVNEYVPNELLAAFMDRADLVVLPYRQATQSGIIQLAFGRAKPVITTAVGGLAEVVEDGLTGLIVPSEDPPALALAVETFFKEELGQMMTREIKARQDRFAWSRLVEKLEELANG